MTLFCIIDFKTLSKLRFCAWWSVSPIGIVSAEPSRSMQSLAGSGTKLLSCEKKEASLLSPVSGRQHLGSLSSFHQTQRFRGPNGFNRQTCARACSAIPVQVHLSANVQKRLQFRLPPQSHNAMKYRETISGFEEPRGKTNSFTASSSTKKTTSETF